MYRNRSVLYVRDFPIFSYRGGNENSVIYLDLRLPNDENRRISQGCAVCSPFSLVLSVMAIYANHSIEFLSGMHGD
jgi:hypothetical protein